MSKDLQEGIAKELREDLRYHGRVIVHACPTFWAMWTATRVDHHGNLEPLDGSYASISRTRAEAAVRWSESSVSVKAVAPSEAAA